MALVEALKEGAAPSLRFVDMSGETTKSGERRASGKGVAGTLEQKSAGKGPSDALRRACAERGIEYLLSNATSYKLG